jgi:PAS domain S-box-containing protein
MKILIVEDDVNSRVFLERALLSQGYTVESAANGVQALEKAELSPPDLIISDIMMPEMDGFELCRRVKTDERLHTIPFVFYTATYIERKDEKLAMALGASHFLIKPMEPEEVFSAVSRVIEEHQAGLLPVPDQLQEEMAELDRMQVEAYARKLDKKVRELEKEREALRFSEERYRSVVENTGIGISLISPNMEILALNKQMRTWFLNVDISSRPICYRSFNDPPREEICSYCPTCKTLQDGQVHEAMTETPAKDKVIFFRVISSPVKDKDGKITAAIEMVEDITERKRAEAEIEKRVKELEDFYSMAIGRELKMKELREQTEEMKEEMERLKKELEKCRKP